MRVPAGRSVQEIDSAQFGFYSPRRQDGRPSLVLVFLNGGFPSDVANTRCLVVFAAGGAGDSPRRSRRLTIHLDLSEAENGKKTQIKGSTQGN
jgi:hypothetical protein